MKVEYFDYVSNFKDGIITDRYIEVERDIEVNNENLKGVIKKASESELKTYCQMFSYSEMPNISSIRITYYENGACVELYDQPWEMNESYTPIYLEIYVIGDKVTIIKNNKRRPTEEYKEKQKEMEEQLGKELDVVKERCKVLDELELKGKFARFIDEKIFHSTERKSYKVAQKIREKNEKTKEKAIEALKIVSLSETKIEGLTKETTSEKHHVVKGKKVKNVSNLKRKQTTNSDNVNETKIKKLKTR